MEDEDGPPPLEDMTDYVKKLTLNSVKYDTVNVVNTVSNQSREKQAKRGKPASQISEPPTFPHQNTTKNNNKTGYGGMKKGFLFGSGASSNEKNTKVKDSPKLIEVKANPTAQKESLKLKEVQDKMSKANEFLDKNSDQWINDDLLSELQTNKTVFNKMNNPQFMAAFAEFQKNPTEAMKKYGDNQEMQEFIQGFSGILGNHFTKLGDKQSS